MSLDKAIKHGKEKRKQYEGGKAFFKSCRNHGDCKRCKNDRLYNQMRDEESSLQRLEEIDILDEDEI